LKELTKEQKIINKKLSWVLNFIKKNQKYISKIKKGGVVLKSRSKSYPFEIQIYKNIVEYKALRFSIHMNNVFIGDITLKNFLEDGVKNIEIITDFNQGYCVNKIIKIYSQEEDPLEFKFIIDFSYKTLDNH
jgi:hypothetical protein